MSSSSLAPFCSYSRQKQLIPRERLNRIMSQSTAGMAHLHGLGITHRDLKPENILVCPDTDQVKVSPAFFLPLERACVPVMPSTNGNLIAISRLFSCAADL
jgi:hypothetical protein